MESSAARHAVRCPLRLPRQQALLRGGPPRRCPHLTAMGHLETAGPPGCVGARRGRSPTPATPAPRRAGLSPSPPLPHFEDGAPHSWNGAPPRVASLRRHHDPLGGAGSPGLRPPASRRTAGSSSSRLPAHASGPAHQACRGAGRAPPTAARPARSRPDPAFDRRARGVGGVRAEAGRVAAHLLRLPGSSRGLQCSRRLQSGLSCLHRARVRISGGRASEGGAPSRTARRLPSPHGTDYVSRGGAAWLEKKRNR